MSSSRFLSTKGLFIAYVVLTVLSCISYLDLPLPEHAEAQAQSLAIAGQLACRALVDVGICVVLVLQVYRTWHNVNLLPSGKNESGWCPMPLTAAVPLLLPVFGHFWEFIAFGYLPRLVKARTGQSLLPEKPIFYLLPFAFLLGLQQLWANLIHAEILPDPGLSDKARHFLGYIAPLHALFCLQATFFLSRFNSRLVQSPIAPDGKQKQHTTP